MPDVESVVVSIVLSRETVEESTHLGLCLLLRVRLDVDIGGAGIELGSIPKQPWY